MSENLKTFGDTAKGLSRNPLGIIALFIVLVYGFAALVTAFASSLSSAEKVPLVYFLVIFPVLVLGVFTWLVMRHSGKLYGPSDYRNEENYIKMQLTAAASLAVATARRPGGDTVDAETDFQQIAAVVQEAAPPKRGDEDSWRSRILWVDDRPDNNVYERQAFEALGLRFSLALSTDEALKQLNHSRFAAIISDMGRREGPQEGYVLLEAIRKQGNKTPFFIYAGSNLPEHKREAAERGAQGSTNDPQELFQLVTNSVIRGRSR